MRTPARRANPSPNTPRLSLQNIVFEADGQSILRGVSLDVMAGEVVCLLGPSGSGKTTLLRIAAGIARQTAGVVEIAGAVVADDRHFVPAETRPLGLVFQDLALFPHMRVLDNVAYGGQGKAAREKARVAMASMGLAGYERAYPHQLSGGEQQRVALARALLPAPEVVLFDEPFSGLDSRLRDEVREDTLALLRDRAATAMLVTHDPQEALAMADKIALMRAGRMVQVASPEEIWRSPVDLEAARMFSPLNIFRARVSGGIVETVIGSVPLGPEREGQDVDVAFRPDGLRVSPLDGGAGVEVAVQRRRFLGSHVEIIGQVGQTMLVLRADPFSDPTAGAGAGAVRVMPDPKQAIILPVQQ